MTDATTIDVGKIARSIARITAAGSNAATATPLVDEVSIIAGYVPGGCCVLPAIGRNVERRVSNATEIVQVMWPAPASSIDAGAAGVAVEIPPGMATMFSSPDCAIWTTS